MNTVLAIMLGALLLLAHPLAAEEPKTEKETGGDSHGLSYSVGYDTGRRMKAMAVDLDLQTFIKAFEEGFAGREAAMTDQEMRDAILPLQRRMAADQAEKKKRAAEESRELAEKNKKEGDAFLAENAKKEGVHALPSGLQYRIIKEGTGGLPKRTDKVEVRYRGTFPNGSEFDSSQKRGKPSTVRVSKVIKGWAEALQLMKEGAQWTLYVPSHLAYGGRGFARNTIGPNQALIFELELLAVLDAADANPGKAAEDE